VKRRRLPIVPAAFRKLDAVAVLTGPLLPAPQIAHLMRRTAAQAGLHLSVRQLLAQLAGIGETVLIYPSTGGRPKARRMTTELTGDQHELHEIFDLAKWAPPKLGHTPKRSTEAHLTSRNSQPASRSSETPARGLGRRSP
jgi:hypothetical protein